MGTGEMNDSDLFKLLISNLQIKAPDQTKTNDFLEFDQNTIYLLFHLFVFVLSIKLIKHHHNSFLVHIN